MDVSRLDHNDPAGSTWSNASLLWKAADRGQQTQAFYSDNTTGTLSWYAAVGPEAGYINAAVVRRDLLPSGEWSNASFVTWATDRPAHPLPPGPATTPEVYRHPVYMFMYPHCTCQLESMGINHGTHAHTHTHTHTHTHACARATRSSTSSHAHTLKHQCVLIARSHTRTYLLGLMQWVPSHADGHIPFERVVPVTINSTPALAMTATYLGVVPDKCVGCPNSASSVVLVSTDGGQQWSPTEGFMSGISQFVELRNGSWLALGRGGGGFPAVPTKEAPGMTRSISHDSGQTWMHGWDASLWPRAAACDTFCSDSQRGRSCL